MTNDRFREAIDVDFGDMDIRCKKELAVLMRRPETPYKRKKRQLSGITEARRMKRQGLYVWSNKGKWFYSVPVDVTQYQLDSAWNHLKKRR